MKTAFLKKAIDPIVYFFWKSQINILRNCPPMCGVVSKYSLGAANSSFVWMKTLLQLTAETPRALLQHSRNKREGRVALARITFLVTTRCSLNCDKCSSHIPDIKCNRDTPFEDIAQYLENLLAGVDYIYAFILSGGEAFLHPDIDKIIRLVAASDKIGDLSMQSNGTFVPNAKVLAALRETNTLVKISNYGAHQPNVDKVMQAFKENSIRYTHLSGTFWNETGEFGQRQEGSAQRRYSACIQQLCMPCLNGKLHRCAKSAVMMEEGCIPDCPDEYVDLRVPNPEAFRAQWEAMLKKRALTACSWCLGLSYNASKIPVAVQRERG